MRAPRPRRAGSLLVGVLLVLVVLASLGSSARVAYAGFGRHDGTAIATEQLRWLEPQTSGSAPEEAADRLPDGAVLQLAMTGLATAADTSRPAPVRLPLLRAWSHRLDRLAKERQGAGGPDAAGDTLLQGWRLLLLTETARLSGEDADVAAVRSSAAPLVAALSADEVGVLGAGAGPARPADTVVVAGAVRRADDAVGVPGARAAIATWLPRLEPLRDQGTMLLPHRVGPGGHVIDGPRASTQAIIQYFWPSLDPATSSRDWVAFENTFLCPRVGLVVVCEYPGGGGGGDALTGPLVAGVSGPATVITMAAARAHGNTALAEQISREVELFGLPSGEGDGRAYLGGRVPLADALLAWARTRPVEAELPGVDDRDVVAWTTWMVCALIPGVLAAAVLTRRIVGRRRRLGGPLEADAVPPAAPTAPDARLEP